jgi:hypothetical protein
MGKMKKLYVAFGFWLIASMAMANQSPAFDFIPKPFNCKYCDSKNSPVIAIDSAHFNYHTYENRFAPFAKVLVADGFKVKSNDSLFSLESLKNVDILVIANALHEENEKNWDLPNYSAFTEEEIHAVYNWVNNGGSLFLIADHMPWPAASSRLAEVFGFGFFNGYVEVTGHSEQFFSKQESSLLKSPVTPSGTTDEIDKVQVFLGQGFTIPINATPILQFTQPAISWMPSKSWQIDENTPFFDATNLYQGAISRVGNGKIAVFGEAGMFTAQIVTEDDETWEMGMNSESASQNQQLLLNIVRWLGDK